MEIKIFYFQNNQVFMTIGKLNLFGKTSYKHYIRSQNNWYHYPVHQECKPNLQFDLDAILRRNG